MIIQQPLINYWRFGHVGYMGWGGGDFVSTFANANANVARSARYWRQKKTKNKRNKTKKSCMIIEKNTWRFGQN